MHTLLVTSSPQDAVVTKLAELVRSRHGGRSPEVVAFDRAEVQFRNTEPDAVFVILGGDQADRAFETVRRLRSAGAAHLFVVGPATNAKHILKAMQVGADLFLDQADLEGDLKSALARLRATQSGAGQAGNLLAVISAAGGCGSSTIAANLAVVLAKEHGRCNLIDLNAGKSDLAPLLDLKPQYSLGDLCRNHERLDRSMYEKLLTPHPTGVELLAAPREFGDGKAVTPRGVARAVALARESFAEVVVDLEDCFHEEQAVVLEQASRVLLVCRLDFTAVRNTRRIIDHLEARGVPRDRIEVVVNHSGLPNELPVAEAEVAIGGAITHFVPHDPEVVCAANNTGIPAAVTATGSAVVRSIARLVGLETPPPPTTNALGRFFTRVRESTAPRVQSVLSRLNRPTTAQPGAATDAAAADTRISHESVLSTIRRAPNARAYSA